MTSDTLKAAFIVAAGLILAAVLAAFINGGIYQIVVAGAGSGGSHDVEGSTEFRAFRLNRFTGNVMVLAGVPTHTLLFETRTLQEFVDEVRKAKATPTEVPPEAFEPVSTPTATR